MLFIILILIIKPFSNLLSENGYFESTLFIKYIINFVNSVNYEKDIIYNRRLYIVQFISKFSMENAAGNI